jgi:hypothetical protein
MLQAFDRTKCIIDFVTKAVWQAFPSIYDCSPKTCISCVYKKAL